MITNRVRSLSGIAVLALSLTVSIVPQAAGQARAAETVAASCPVPADHLYDAAERNVELERIAPVPSWRSNCDELFRADGRGPDIVFAEGFHPRDVANGQYDLASYVANNQPSPYVSTTYDHDLFKKWKSAWNYYVDAPGGIDVNATIGYQHKYASQMEVAFPGGIDSKFIVGVCPVDTTTKSEILTGCERNPKYVPWRGIPAAFPGQG
jgi:hypothetical protein